LRLTWLSVPLVGREDCFEFVGIECGERASGEGLVAGHLRPSPGWGFERMHLIEVAEVNLQHDGPSQVAFEDVDRSHATIDVYGPSWLGQGVGHLGQRQARPGCSEVSSLSHRGDTDVPGRRDGSDAVRQWSGVHLAERSAVALAELPAKGLGSPQVTERALRDLVPRDLRHTAANLAISAGANVKACRGCSATRRRRSPSTGTHTCSMTT